MSTELTCNQCSLDFDSNFALYNHKVKEHGLTMAIVSNPNLKRGPQPSELDEHPAKFIKVDHVGGIKRERGDDSEDGENAQSMKYRRLNDKRGVKRSLKHDDEGVGIKFRRLSEKQGVKRKISSNHGKRKYRKVYESEDDESSDDDLDYQAMKNRGLKRQNSDSDDPERDAKRIRGEIKSLHLNRNLIDRLKLEVARYKKLYNGQKRKMEETEKECEKKIQLFKKQIKELEELDSNGDYDTNTLTNAVINSVSIQEFNNIRKMIEGRQWRRVLRSKKNILALQKLFLGLIYGVIPITQPQRIALSEDLKHMIRKLENASVDSVRLHIQDNKDMFLHLFEVINDSIKLISRSYERFGLN